MTTDDRGGVALAAVVADLVDDAVADYRIDRPSAVELVEDVVGQDRNLRVAATRQPELGRLRRTRAFRDVRKRVRKKIYYALRRYKSASASAGLELPALARNLAEARDVPEIERVTEEILAHHSSTRERLASRKAFTECLLGALDRPRRVLDVGCGVYPLMFPFADLAEDLDLYLALDRDVEVIDALRTFAEVRPEPRLEAHEWQVAEGWEALPTEVSAAERFDVALMFKLVPVIARQEAASLEILARVPATRIVTSGSRRALAKRADIERRERSVLKRWIDDHGFTVIDEFVVDEEFVLVLERRRPVQR